MKKTIEFYQEEKVLREKRLTVYIEEIQGKVQKDSEQIIKELVEERYRQKKTRQEMSELTGVRTSNVARFERVSSANLDYVGEVCECAGETYRDKNM